MKLLMLFTFMIATTAAQPAIAQQTPEPATSPETTATATPVSTETTTPQEEASAAPETAGGFDMSKLTPEQREAVRLAIIKLSENPIGNITVFESQNNFNYGVGPYTRYGYNMNVEPVVPNRNISVLELGITHDYSHSG